VICRCLPDSDRECPQCAVQHRMISEIRRAQEENAEKHDLFFEQVINYLSILVFVMFIISLTFIIELHLTVKRSRRWF
jgi:hypothetical protein